VAPRVKVSICKRTSNHAVRLCAFCKREINDKRDSGGIDRDFTTVRGIKIGNIIYTNTINRRTYDESGKSFSMSSHLVL